MGEARPTREDAWNLFKEHNKSESLIKHALAVEAVLRHVAQKLGEEAETWGAVGLIHDLDYEKHPDEHCKKSAEILRDAGWPDDIIRAVLSHGWPRYTDAVPETLLEKYLFAVDELTGLVAAAALIRPSKSVLDLKVKSVRKKFKDKRFAAGVDREIIQKGAEMLGVELSELIEDTIMGMREVAEESGLKGTYLNSILS